MTIIDCTEDSPSSARLTALCVRDRQPIVNDCRLYVSRKDNAPLDSVTGSFFEVSNRTHLTCTHEITPIRATSRRRLPVPTAAHPSASVSRHTDYATGNGKCPVFFTLFRFFSPLRALTQCLYCSGCVCQPFNKRIVCMYVCM